MQRGGHFAAGRQVGRDKLHTLGQAVVPYGPVQHVQACLGRAQVMVRHRQAQGPLASRRCPASGVRAMASALRSRARRQSVATWFAPFLTGPVWTGRVLVWKRSAATILSSAATKCVAFTHEPRKPLRALIARRLGIVTSLSLHPWQAHSRRRKRNSGLTAVVGLWHHQWRQNSWLTYRAVPLLRLTGA